MKLPILTWLPSVLYRLWFRILLALRQTWYKELRISQDDVKRYCENTQYQTAYSAAELYYWHPVAKWLYQDALLYRGGRILDIGSAYGTLAVYTSRLFEAGVHCVDFTDCYLSDALRKKYEICFAVNNIELDPLPWEGQFDVIIFTEILEHLNFNPVPTMQKLRKALKSGGRLYLSTPDAAEWGRLPVYSDFRTMPLPRPHLPAVDAHVYQYNLSEVKELAELTGFRVEREAFSIGLGGRHINVVLVPD